MRFLWLAMSIITLMYGINSLLESSEAQGLGQFFVIMFPPVAFFWLAYRAHCRAMMAKRNDQEGL